MWKIQNVLVIRILCEINFGGSRSSKTAIFTLFWALNFVNLVDFTFQKGAKLIKRSKFGVFKYVKMADFDTLHLPTLISRKILVTEKFCNFHSILLVNVLQGLFGIIFINRIKAGTAFIKYQPQNDKFQVCSQSWITVNGTDNVE